MCTSWNDEVIPDILVDAYNNMSKEDKAYWSRSEARILIEDMKKYDQARGYKPLSYDLEDVYTFIRELILQDSEDTE